ncbi:MAG: AAA-associated domain-containing protein [Candidatus Lokiarchaeota archaeon]|nr:AAA-associated domain-containing protein [Candidatus Lokiarchaeota archaeon]
MTEKLLDTDKGKQDYIDPIVGEDPLLNTEKSGRVSQIAQKLHQALNFNDNEWIQLALDLLVGKMIMDYKYLVMVKYSEYIGLGKQNIFLVHDIGTLVNDFVSKREIDLENKEFRKSSGFTFNRGSVINHLTSLIDFSSKNEKKYNFNQTYLRNFSTIAYEFDKNELDPEIPVYIYKELVERVPVDMFETPNQRKRFQNNILELRREETFTDRHLRIIINLVREDPINRAKIEYIRRILPDVKEIKTSMSFPDALNYVKSIEKSGKQKKEQVLPSLEQNGVLRLPQANDVSKFIKIVQDVSHGITKPEQLADNIEISERQIHYYKDAAQILNLLTENGRNYTFTLTSIGQKLAETKDENEQNEILYHQIMKTEVIKHIFLMLKESQEDYILVEEYLNDLKHRSALSDSTIARRTAAIISWIRWIESYNELLRIVEEKIIVKNEFSWNCVKKQILEIINKYRTINTLANGKPNIIEVFDDTGLMVKTDHDSEAKKVSFNTIKDVWFNLVEYGELELDNHELTSYRSSFVCSLLSQLPIVNVLKEGKISIKLVGI